MKSKYKSLIKKLDKLFADYIKKRDCYICFTCGKVLIPNSRNCQAGHYISRRIMATRFDPINVHCQCSYCNKYLAGNFIRYRKNLIELYGDDVVNELELKMFDKKKFTIGKLEELVEYYKKQLQ